MDQKTHKPDGKKKGRDPQPDHHRGSRVIQPVWARSSHHGADRRDGGYRQGDTLQLLSLPRKPSSTLSSSTLSRNGTMTASRSCASLPDTRTRLTAVFRVLIEGVQAQKEIFEAFMVYRMKQVTSFKPVDEGEQSGLSFLIHEIIELGQRKP